MNPITATSRQAAARAPARPVEPPKLGSAPEPADVWHERQLARGPAGRRAIRRALVELAGMIGRAHAAGARLYGLTCRRLLVTQEGDWPHLAWGDVRRVRRGRLSRRARAKDLAALLYDRRGFTTRTERLRFLKHYLEAQGSDGTASGWQIMVEDLARRHGGRQDARHDRLVVGSNRHFTRLRLGGGWRGHAMLAGPRWPAWSAATQLVFEAPQWHAALADPEALFRGAGVAVVAETPTSTVVRRRLRVGRHEVEVFVHRQRPAGALATLTTRLRGGPAARAFRLGHSLVQRRVPVALPLAALEWRRGPGLADSILITEAVDAPPLGRFLDAHLAAGGRDKSPLTRTERRRLAREVLWQLGRLLQRLHDNNYAHRALKARDLLVRWRAGRNPQVVLVGLDGLRRCRSLTARQRFAGLMRLNVSLLQSTAVNRAERLRLLVGYLRRPGGGPVNFKPYWRMLADWSSRRLAQQIRTRRRRQKAARRPAP